jgi:hypothetical protein
MDDVDRRIARERADDEARDELVSNLDRIANALEFAADSLETIAELLKPQVIVGGAVDNG